MREKKNYQSWTISNEFWKAIKEDIPKRERDPKNEYNGVYSYNFHAF